MRWMIGLGLVMLTQTVAAESTVYQLGRQVGIFGKGLVHESLSLEPEWETVEPRSREACLAESGGVLDVRYMRCRNGRQEWVRYDPDGRRRVLRERPIP